MNIPDSYLLHKSKLNGEYREAFEHIEAYCNIVLPDSSSFMDCMNYLMDIFLSAQAEGTPVAKITGCNIEEFCKNFISDTTLTGILKSIFNYIKNLCWIMLVLLALYFIVLSPELLSGNESLWSILKHSSDKIQSLTLGLLTGAITGIVSKLIVRIFIFRVKRYRKIYHTIVDILTYLVAFIIMLVHLENFKPLPVTTGVVLAISLGYLLCYYIIRGIINIRNGRTFFSSKQIETKISFTDSVMTGLVDEFRKIYNKQNAKRAKKGLSPLSHSEYMEKLFKDTKKIVIFVLCVYISLQLFYVILAIIETANTNLTNCIGSIILVVTAYNIFMIPLTIIPIRIRKKLCDILEKNNRTVFDEDIYDFLNNKH